MALDLEEQEQVDALKAWWKANGNKVIAGVVIFVVGVAGYRGWNYYQHKQMREAARVHQALLADFAGGDAKKVRTAAGELIDKYPRTAYAVDAAFMAAKSNFEGGDLKSARNQLKWVLDHAKDAPARDLARLRLAVVATDEKNYEEALKFLDAKHDAAFDVLYMDLRGDVLAILGKAGEAQNAYRIALDKLPKGSPARELIQIKLDGLGSQG